MPANVTKDGPSPPEGDRPWPATVKIFAVFLAFVAFVALAAFVAFVAFAVFVVLIAFVAVVVFAASLALLALVAFVVFAAFVVLAACVAGSANCMTLSMRDSCWNGAHMCAYSSNQQRHLWDSNPRGGTPSA